MIKCIKPLPVSEEMLGAYLEGNLSAEESFKIAQLIGMDESLSELLDDVEELTLMEGSDSIYDDFPDFGEDYMLPEILDATDILGGFECMAAAMPDLSLPIIENIQGDDDIWDDAFNLSAHCEGGNISSSNGDMYMDDSDSFSDDDPYTSGSDLLDAY